MGKRCCENGDFGNKIDIFPPLSAQKKITLEYLWSCYAQQVRPLSSALIVIMLDVDELNQYSLAPVAEGLKWWGAVAEFARN